MDNIKCTRYINLERRPDRKKRTEEEFAKINFTRYERFQAVESTTHGGIGCAMSHVGVIEEFMKNSAPEDILMICEDDIEILHPRETIDALIREFQKDKSADAMCLGFGERSLSQYRGTSFIFFRANHVETTSCYLVKNRPEFLNELIDCFVDAAKCILDNPSSYHKNAIDQRWKQVQSRYIFLIPKQHIVKQISGYSDIVNRVVTRHN
jgi:hypothetical protein